MLGAAEHNLQCPVDNERHRARRPLLVGDRFQLFVIRLSKRNREPFGLDPLCLFRLFLHGIKCHQVSPLGQVLRVLFFNASDSGISGDPSAALLKNANLVIPRKPHVQRKKSLLF